MNKTIKLAGDLYYSVYVIGVSLMSFVGIYALYLTYAEKKDKKSNFNLEYYLAAKGTQSTPRTVYSLIATSLGTWILITPPSFSSYYGILGAVAFAFGSSLCLAIPAILGPIIQRNSNNALSLGDYCRQRYGWIGQFYMSAICLLNIFLSLVSELTIMGQIFETIVGGNRIFIVVFTCFLTAFYTAFGGLSVSIKTDQVQGIFSLIAIVIFSLYMAAKFRIDRSIPLPDYLNANKMGAGTLGAHPLGFFGYMTCNEAFWQRAWASKSPREFRKASLISAIILFIIVFLFGFYGFIEAWQNYFGVTYNLQLFSIFKDNHPVWILVILVVLSMIMGEAEIDSFQIAMVSSLSTCFLKNYPLWITQIMVFLIDIPAIVVSLQNLNMIGVNLVIGLICVSVVPAFFLGFWKKIQKYHTFVNLVLSSFFGIFFISYWGVRQQHNDTSAGLKYVFYQYWGYEPFLINFVGATVVSLFISLLHLVLDKTILEKAKKMKTTRDLETEQITSKNLFFFNNFFSF